eukprot:TRINITY_DN313_c0_g1_i1.p2 TRINITY_DN313_c0_g1~~TRINITY_DN313_c0_g1_i1.p2  ORF type:complete len:118 (+),score=34.64 TRINITY_DN313_c0_g1_i1:232-585(+)
MGFLFSSEESPAPAPAEADAVEELPREDDNETFRTMEMMAKTLRDVGKPEEAQEVERQLSSLKKSLRKLSGDKAFSTVRSGDEDPVPEEDAIAASAEASEPTGEPSGEPEPELSAGA